MEVKTKIAVAVAAAIIAGSASAARAQTVVNLTNLDPSNTTGFSYIGNVSQSSGTSLDLLNTTTALSGGGLFGGAVSNQTQQATNQLNTIGLTSLGAAAPVVLGNQTPITGTPTVTINTIASAYNAIGAGASISAGTSTTINNTNAAISSGVNQIVGAPSGLNDPYTGGYGPTAGNVQVGGNQVGVNTVNGVGAAFASGTAVSLSQLPGAPQGSYASGTASLMNVVGGPTTITNGDVVTIAGNQYVVSGIPAAGLALGLFQYHDITLTAVTSGTSSNIVSNGNQNVYLGSTMIGVLEGTASGNASEHISISGGGRGTPIIQGGALNMSTVNTLLAYTGAGAASVNGSGSTAGSPGAQTAVNTFNTATLVGDIGVAVQQKADGLNSLQTTFQSVNRALAYSAGATSANVDPSVTNLNQTAAVGVNALNLVAGSTGASTLSGTQSTGYNTIGTVSGNGATAVPVVSNQIVASTTGAGGFLPNGTNDTYSFGVPVAAGSRTDAWTSLMGQVGASSAPTPGQGNYGSLNISSRLTGAADAMSLGSGVVAVGNVSQAVSLTNNTVSAGTTAAPVATTFGPAGFAQTAGVIGIASNSNGLNGVSATTGVGASSLNGVTQAFQSANNTFQGTGNVSGALSQSASGINFAAGAMVAPGTPYGGNTVSPNGGSGQYNGNASNAGPYVVQLANGSGNGVLNNAYASSSYGTAGLTGVTQNGNTFANVASTAGTIDPGAASTLSQSMGTIANYGGSQSMPTNIAAADGYLGNTSVASVTQGLSLTANAVSGTAGVNGSVAQVSGDTNYMQPRNYLTSQSETQGSAALSGNTQTNFTSLNSIASNGALGSASSPAAFSQQSGPTTTGITAFSPTGNAGNNTFFTPSNQAMVNSNLGAGGSATSNGLTQAAALNVNSITGGTAAGTGITGNATQSSTGRSSTISNYADALAMEANPFQPTNVMSGNATMLNTAQSAAQSLNTMSLAGANNGILNQATFGATNQSTGNASRATSYAGYAVTTGAQLATNAVNVISAR